MRLRSLELLSDISLMFVFLSVVFVRMDAFIFSILHCEDMSRSLDFFWTEAPILKLLIMWEWIIMMTIRSLQLLSDISLMFVCVSVFCVVRMDALLFSRPHCEGMLRLLVFLNIIWLDLPSGVVVVFVCGFHLSSAVGITFFSVCRLMWPEYAARTSDSIRNYMMGHCARISYTVYCSVIIHYIWYYTGD